MSVAVRSHSRTSSVFARFLAAVTTTSFVDASLNEDASVDLLGFTDTAHPSSPLPRKTERIFHVDSVKSFQEDHGTDNAMPLDLPGRNHNMLDVINKSGLSKEDRSQSSLANIFDWMQDPGAGHGPAGDGASDSLLSTSTGVPVDIDRVTGQRQEDGYESISQVIAHHRPERALGPRDTSLTSELYDKLAKHTSDFAESISGVLSDSKAPNGDLSLNGSNPGVYPQFGAPRNLTNSTRIDNSALVQLFDQPHSSLHRRHQPMGDDITSMVSKSDVTSETTTSFPGYINSNNISFEDDDRFSGSSGLFSGNGLTNGIVDSLLANLSAGCEDWGFPNSTCLYGSNGTNGTNESLADTMDLPQPVRYWTLFLLIFPMLTVFGNILVVMSVHKEKSLRTVTNYFIVSLAIADIMVAVLVMPIAVYVEVNNSFWTLGAALCDTWVAFDVMCCTASILNLTAISVDRFIAVTQPIKYARHKNSNRVYIMLALTWIVSIAISSPIALGMNYTEQRSENLCIFYNSDFLIYSSMGSFYIPCLIMVLLYWRIFRAIRLRAQKAKAKKLRVPASTFNVIENKAQTGKTTSDASATEDSCHKELLPAGNSSSSGRARAPRPLPIAEETSFTNFNAKLHSTTENDEEDESQSHSQSHSHGEVGGVMRSPISDETAQMLPNEKSTDFMATSDDNSAHVAANHSYRDVETGYDAPVHVEVDAHLSGNMTSPTTQKTLLSPPPRRAIMSPGVGVKNHIPGRKTRRNNNKESPKKIVTKFNFHLNRHHSKKKKDSRCSNRRERKATKTLAIVLGVFLFCWVPFFTVNIMNAICIRFDIFNESPACNIDGMLFSFFVWLGYINSFLNPVIYTIFNIEFRRAFKKLLWQPCK